MAHRTLSPLFHATLILSVLLSACERQKVTLAVGAAKVELANNNGYFTETKIGSYQVASELFAIETAEGRAKSANFEPRNIRMGSQTAYGQYYWPQFDITATIRYYTSQRDGVIYKNITLANPRKLLVKSVTIADLRFRQEGLLRHFQLPTFEKPPWNIQLGRPLVIADRIFLSAMHPASNQRKQGSRLIIDHDVYSHAPLIALPTVVLGASQNTAAVQSLRNFLEKKRKPPRRYRLWNVYLNKYDHIWSKGGLKTTIRVDDPDLIPKLKKALVPTIVESLDGVVVDGGWADPQGLAIEDSRAPQRLAKIKAELSSLGLGMGLHVITHGVRPSVDKSWLAERLAMATPTAFCGGDAAAKRAMTQNLVHLVKKYQIEALKFDWGQFTSQDPRPECQTVPIVDAHISLLDRLRQASPGIVLYDTGWYSPWWLLHYDAVFSGGHDMSQSLSSPPVLHESTIQSTFRDDSIYRNIVLTGSTVPFNGLMNHDPVGYDWADPKGGGVEPSLRAFSDMIAIDTLRGNILHENYLDLTKFNIPQRKILNAFLTWVEKNIPENAATYYLGGTPFLGVTYGYFHPVKRDFGYAIVKNPTLFPRVARLTKKNGSAPSQWRQQQIYPSRVDLPSAIDVAPEGTHVIAVKCKGRCPAFRIQSEPMESQSANTTISPRGTNLLPPQRKNTEVLFLLQLKSIEDQDRIHLSFPGIGSSAKIERFHNARFPELIKKFEPTTGWKIYRLKEWSNKSIPFQLKGPQGAKVRLSVISNSPSQLLDTARGHLPTFSPHASQVLLFRKVLKL